MCSAVGGANRCDEVGALYPLTTIEVFAGAGGLALGFEQAGFEPLALIECDKHACATLRANRPNWNVIEEDVHDVDFTPYQNKASVVTGGAPCQAFSYAGKRLGFGDVRGTLFAEFARCVSETKPLMLVFENVKGLLNHDSGKTFATIVKTFEELGYVIQYKVLNASYYSVGQARERLIIVGIRNDVSNSLRFDYPLPSANQTTLRDALNNVPDSPYIPYSDAKRHVLDLVPPGGCWIDLPDDVARAYMGKSYYSGGGRRGIARRLSWDAPSLTLTTSPSQKQTERCHPDKTRPLTIREYARVQSFPDTWHFEGPLASQYRQIGNAVPVELARRIALEVRNALSGLFAVSERGVMPLAPGSACKGGLSAVRSSDGTGQIRTVA